MKSKHSLIDVPIIVLMSYGHRLNEALTLAKKERKELADAIGVSVQAIGQVITGKTAALTAENSALAARYLRVDQYWLATGEGEAMDNNNPPIKSANDGEELSPFARSLARLYDSLPKDDHSALMRVFHDAAAPILAYKDQAQGNQPIAAPQENSGIPAATHQQPTARHT